MQFKRTVKLSWQTSCCQQYTANQRQDVLLQVGKAASKGGSVADKAGGAVKDIKGKNPLGELIFMPNAATVPTSTQKLGSHLCAACVERHIEHPLQKSAAVSMDME